MHHGLTLWFPVDFTRLTRSEVLNKNIVMSLPLNLVLLVERMSRILDFVI